MIQRRFNVGVLEAISERKAWHALSSPREMIARPKMSRIEWKSTEIRAWQSWPTSHPFPAQVPEEVLAASLAAPPNTLRALTPHVDFIARIRNDDDPKGGPNAAPTLEALETVDTSGDWLCGNQIFNPTSMCA